MHHTLPLAANFPQHHNAPQRTTPTSLNHTTPHRVETMSSFFVALENLLRWNRGQRRNYNKKLPMNLTAMVAPDTNIEMSVVMLPVPARGRGRSKLPASESVEEQRLRYKAFLLFGVSSASEDAEPMVDSISSFFR